MIPEIEYGLQNVTLGTVTALAQAIGTDVRAEGTPIKEILAPVA